MNIKTSVILCCLLTLVGCDSDDESQLALHTSAPEKADYDDAFERLTFDCIYERDHLPPLDAEAQVLYLYGLHLTQKPGLKDFDQAARYYRIAAVFGHYRASTNLQALLSQGLTNAPQAAKETINLVQESIARNIPGAYYDMGHYLELGYGVQQDSAAARVYFRRAADLGSPEAQYYVADTLRRIKGAGDVAFKMLRCAKEQGHAEAAVDYGVATQLQKNFADALAAYQVAVQSGDSANALRLEIAFDAPEQDSLYYLTVDKDSERSRRYKLIGEFLRKHEHLGAKVPDIDQIVPLPPAKLPDWDETFEWKRKRDAAVPPSPPSEELIARMCKEKQLDPATGWPLSGLR
jgi:TPR repeat protein